MNGNLPSLSVRNASNAPPTHRLLCFLIWKKYIGCMLLLSGVEIGILTILRCVGSICWTRPAVLLPTLRIHRLLPPFKPENSDRRESFG